MEVIYNLFIISLLQTSFVCNFNDSLSVQILGNWGYCKDGTYFELYINDSTIYEMNDKIPLLTKEFYQIEENKLEIFNNENREIQKYINIESINTDHIVFKFIEKEKSVRLDLFRLKECINIPFYDKNSPEMTELFEKEFMNRAKIYRLKYNCMEDNETVPPPDARSMSE